MFRKISLKGTNLLKRYDAFYFFGNKTAFKLYRPTMTLFFSTKNSEPLQQKSLFITKKNLTSNYSNLGLYLDDLKLNLPKYKKKDMIEAIEFILRFVPSSSAKIVQLKDDETYKQLIKKLGDEIENIEAKDLPSLIDSITIIGISNQEDMKSFTEKLSNRITALVNDNQIETHLFSEIFYKIHSAPQSHFDSASNTLLSKIANNKEKLTINDTILILRGLSNSERLSANSMLPHILQRKIEENFDKIEVEQASEILKLLAKLELHLFVPKFKPSQILFDLKNKLRQNLDELDEENILNIIEAHAYLPITFQYDLLKLVKDMLVTTLQRRDSNINSEFLLKILRVSNSLRKSLRFDQENIKMIYAILQSRISKDSYFMNLSNIETISHEYFIRGTDGKELLREIFHFLSKRFQGETKYIPVKTLSILKNSGFDTKKFSKPELSLNTLSIHEMAMFAIFLNDHTYDLEETAKLKEKIILKIPDLDHINILELIKYIRSTNIQNEMTSQLMKEAIKIMHSKKKDIDINLYTTSFVFSCYNSESRNQWFDLYNDQWGKVSRNELLSFFNSIVENDDKIEIDHIIFISRLVSSCKVDKLPINEILAKIRDSKKFLNEFIRIEGLFYQLMTHILRALEGNPKGLDYSTIYSFMKKVEQTGIDFEVIRDLALNTWRILRNEESDVLIKFHFVFYLLEHDILSLRDAKLLYESYEKNAGLVVSSNLLAYLMRKSDDILKYSETASTNISRLARELSSSNIRSSVKNISCLLAFPPYLTESHHEQIEKYLEIQNRNINLELSVECLNSINYKNYSLNPAFYDRILSQCFKNIEGSEMMDVRHNFLIKIIKKLVSLKIYDSNILKESLKNLFYHSDLFRIEEIIQILAIFNDAGILNQGYFKKLQRKIIDERKRINYHKVPIMKNIIELSLESEIDDQILKIFYEWSKLDTTCAFYKILMDIVQSKTNQKDRVNEDISKLKKLSNAFQNYLKFVIKNDNLVNKFKSLVISSSSDELLDKRETIDDLYLKLQNCGLKFEKNKNFNGYNIDLYFPKENKHVILTNRSVIKDNGNQKIIGVLIQKIVSSIQLKEYSVLSLADYAEASDRKLFIGNKLKI